MMRSFTIGAAVLAAAALIVSGAMAQSKGAEPAKTEKPMGQRVEGTIKSVDGKGIVTLEDGTRLMIPKSVSVPKDKLKPGATITAEYEEKGGRKVATTVKIHG